MTRFEQGQEYSAPNEKKERDKKSLIATFAKLGLTAALAMSIGSGLSSCGESAAAETNSQPTSEQPADNSGVENAADSSQAETPATPEKSNQEQLAELGLSTTSTDPGENVRQFNEIAHNMSEDELVSYLEIQPSQSDDLLANTVLDRLTKWTQAGTYYDLHKNVKAMAHLPEIATAQKDIYTEALFADGWSTNSGLSLTADWFEKMDNGAITGYVATAWNQDTHPEDVKPFTDWMTIHEYSVLHKSNGDIDLTIDFNEDCNGGKENIAPAITDTTGRFHMILTPEDNVLKISDLEYLNIDF